MKAIHPVAVFSEAINEAEWAELLPPRGILYCSSSSFTVRSVYLSFSVWSLEVVKMSEGSNEPAACQYNPSSPTFCLCQSKCFLLSPSCLLLHLVTPRKGGRGHKPNDSVSFILWRRKLTVNFLHVWIQRIFWRHLYLRVHSKKVIKEIAEINYNDKQIAEKKIIEWN